MVLNNTFQLFWLKMLHCLGMTGIVMFSGQIGIEKTSVKSTTSSISAPSLLKGVRNLGLL
jgi:hypothetical protein